MVCILTNPAVLRVKPLLWLIKAHFNEYACVCAYSITVAVVLTCGLYDQLIQRSRKWLYTERLTSS